MGDSKKDKKRSVSVSARPDERAELIARGEEHRFETVSEYVLALVEADLALNLRLTFDPDTKRKVLRPAGSFMVAETQEAYGAKTYGPEDDLLLTDSQQAQKALRNRTRELVEQMQGLIESEARMLAARWLKEAQQGHEA